MKRALLLMCEGVEVYEAAAFYDVLGWSGAEGFEPVEVVTAGLTDEVRCAFGLRVRCDMRLDQARLRDLDALAVPGGFAEHGFYEQAYSAEVSDLIRDFARQGKPIASICVGALPLAKSGVLTNRPATTYSLSGGHRRRQLAELGARVVDAPIVIDGRIVTSTGPGTAVDVAFWLLAELVGSDTAAAIRHLMGFSGSSGGPHPSTEG